jgi:hypothetical protein
MVLRFLADHNFNFDIVRGARRRGVERSVPVDIVIALDMGLAAADDPALLEWAAAQKRIVLTRDVNTLVGFAWDRVREGRIMPGVFATRNNAPVGQVIEDLLILSECGTAGEWEGKVLYLPLS